MDKLEGGFVIHKAPAILRGVNAHTIGLPGRPISEADLLATNRMQATPWDVNREVAAVARELLTDPDVACPLIPGDVLLPYPGKVEPDAWKALGEAGQKRVRVERGKIHRENASRQGRRQAFLEALGSATSMEAFPAHWYVHTHDFRLRRYVVAVGGLSPQGDDLSKSLIRFRDGKPLGAEGLYWLCVRGANCYGLDKLDLDERVGWAMDNASLFRAISRDPLRWGGWTHRVDGSGKEVEEPWGFLATALELGRAFEMADPTAFVSHLPVPCDGTANGLQHLSAMGLDPVGAMATNLCAGVPRQDPYIAVATKAAEIVEREAAKGLPEAMLWYGKVDRGTVKRAVLATPYGVTDGGIQRQLLEDDLVPDHDADLSDKAAAAFMRDVIVESLSGTVVAAKAIMAWLQTCAQRLGEAGQPVVWQTPMGSTIAQAYRARTVSRTDTLVGKVDTIEETPGGGLDVKKQALGVSPQVVHSFDAAHLAATVNACAEGYGISAFSMIHDSFGTHAADTGIMQAVNRECFVRQYTPDRLVELAEGFKAYAPHVDIPDPPARGSFDLAANVPAARFFFS